MRSISKDFGEADSGRRRLLNTPAKLIAVGGWNALQQARDESGQEEDQQTLKFK